MISFTCCFLLLLLLVFDSRIDAIDAASPAGVKTLLLNVFGGNDTAATPRQLPTPPQYMLDLFRSVADEAGISKAPNPYRARVIRSYVDRACRGCRGGNRMEFNISGVRPDETLLEAELRVYTLNSSALQPHVVFVYQILEAELSGQAEEKRLIDVRFVSTPTEGWQVFRVKSAVQHWISKATTHHLTLSVVAITALGRPAPLRLTRRGDRSSNRQPLLVLFNDDPSAPSQLSSYSDGDDRKARQRQRRATSGVGGDHCRRRELYVDFESIGWSQWIIAPVGYQAYHCHGTCSFPLTQSQRPTNHATVQSIVHHMKQPDAGDITAPCCVPASLSSLTLLYYDEGDNVVLKQYRDMIADTCGCI